MRRKTNKIRKEVMQMAVRHVEACVSGEDVIVIYDDKYFDNFIEAIRARVEFDDLRVIFLPRWRISGWKIEVVGRMEDLDD